VWTDAGLFDQLRRQLARQRFDLACELALLGGQLQDAVTMGHGLAAAPRLKILARG
jgi:hypothetical protein